MIHALIPPKSSSVHEPMNSFISFISKSTLNLSPTTAILPNDQPQHATSPMTTASDLTCTGEIRIDGSRLSTSDLGPRLQYLGNHSINDFTKSLAWLLLMILQDGGTLTKSEDRKLSPPTRVGVLNNQQRTTNNNQQP